MDRASDLRDDYDWLGLLLAEELDPVKAVALVRERRLLGAELEVLEAAAAPPPAPAPDPEVPVVDQLAARRSGTRAAVAPSRRRQPG